MNVLHLLFSLLAVYLAGATLAAPLNVRKAFVQTLMGPEITEMKSKIDELSSLVTDLRHVVKNITVHGERIKRLGTIKL